MSRPVPKKCKEDEDRVLSPRSETIRNPIVRRDPLQETFLLHLAKSAGKDARREARIVAQDLSESGQLQKCHISKD
jgi:hypothetical protein